MKAWRDAQIGRIIDWEHRPGSPYRAYKTDTGIWIVWDRRGSMHPMGTLPEVMGWVCSQLGGDRA